MGKVRGQAEVRGQRRGREDHLGGRSKKIGGLQWGGSRPKAGGGAADVAELDEAAEPEPEVEIDILRQAGQKRGALLGHACRHP